MRCGPLPESCASAWEILRRSRSSEHGLEALCFGRNLSQELQDPSLLTNVRANKGVTPGGKGSRLRVARVARLSYQTLAEEVCCKFSLLYKTSHDATPRASKFSTQLQAPTGSNASAAPLLGIQPGHAGFASLCFSLHDRLLNTTSFDILCMPYSSAVLHPKKVSCAKLCFPKPNREQVGKSLVCWV